MDKPTLARALNAWMKAFTEHPEKFEAEFQTVVRFLKEQSDGQEPSYGEHCAELLYRYANLELESNVPQDGGETVLPLASEEL